MSNGLNPDQAQCFIRLIWVGNVCKSYQQITLVGIFTGHSLNITILELADIKGVKKVRSAIKLCSYYFIYYVPNDINVTGIL